MTQRPRVTVIIPTYNWSSVLRHSVRSVLGQTFREFELLVIGDACTDDSEEVVKSFDDPRVRWINLPSNTRHQSGPNNEGLKQARAGIIAYLGHDDLWLPHHLAVHVSALESSGSDLTHSLGVSVAADGNSAWPMMPRPENGVFGAPLCIVHRKSVTDRVGGWRHYREIAISPDIDLWQRAYTAGCKFTFVPRLTGIKFPASWRRDIYKTRPSHEQATWLARIESEPDFEVRRLAEMVAGRSAMRGLPYRELVGSVLRETASRLRMRLTLPWLGFAYSHGGIDAIRRYKGL